MGHGRVARGWGGVIPRVLYFRRVDVNYVWLLMFGAWCDECFLCFEPL